MKIAFVTNIITPYRKKFFDELNTQLIEDGGELHVYAMTDSLPLRPWTFSELKSNYMTLVPGYKFIVNETDYDILINPSINTYLKKYNPDIVIVAGSWTYPTTFLMLYRKLKGVKYLLWTESHDIRGIEKKSDNHFISKIKKSLYLRFDGFCVPGKYTIESLKNFLGENITIVQLPNMVDNEFYSLASKQYGQREQLRAKYNIPLDCRVFITPARLINRKGLDVFLSHLTDAICKNARFVIAGIGPLEGKIKSIAEHNNLHVIFLGYCNQNTIRELYGISDVFLLPSLFDQNPLTSIEAAFASLPLMLSKYVGNSPELCFEGENGFIFDTTVGESVRKSVGKILSKSDDWLRKAGQRSHEIAIAGFECKSQTSKFLTQLKHLVYSDKKDRSNPTA